MHSRWIAGAAVLASTAGCIGMLMSVHRYTCRDDGECDKGANEECRGVELVTDARCSEPPEDDGPYYLSEAGQQTCIMFYCAPKGVGTICGENNCVDGRSCIARLNDQGKVELGCEDHDKVDPAPACTGFDDADCPDNRCVRYLDWKLENPASGEPSYRCLPG